MGKPTLTSRLLYGEPVSISRPAPVIKAKHAPPDWGEIPKAKQQFGGSRVTRVVDTSTGKEIPRRGTQPAATGLFGTRKYSSD